MRVCGHGAALDKLAFAPALGPAALGSAVVTGAIASGRAATAQPAAKAAATTKVIE